GAALLVGLARRYGWSELIPAASAGTEVGETDGGRDSLARALALAPYLALVPAIAAVLGSVRVQISHHRYFHSAYVYPVPAVHVPPETVTLPGHPSNPYWPYHALLAAIVSLFAVPAPLASALMNVVVLAGSLAWTSALVRQLYAGAVAARWRSLCTIFGL